ncbi:helix-turn-helix transcriptional regulator [Actinomadura sp. NPDC047616]|uniref:helix-turn-helix transcriptional regulator n=1 Tax=Actinomadura sp. NPDC047616 TaxID=3155914 RepID=UPI0033C438A4
MSDVHAVQDLAAVIHLLGNPGRLRLLTALLEGGEMCESGLAAVTGQGESGCGGPAPAARTRW